MQINYVSSEDTSFGIPKKAQAVGEHDADSGNFLSHDKKAEEIAKSIAYSTNISPFGIQHGDQNPKSKPNLTINKPSRPQEAVPDSKGTADSTTKYPYPSPKVPSNSELQTNSTGSVVAGAIPSNARTSDTKSTNSLSNHGQGMSNRGRSNSLENSSAHFKPHTGGDVRWDAVNAISKGSSLNLSNFRLLKRLGYGDIGSVYLVELRGTKAYFAMKVMDKASLASRNKLLRAQTEREILGLLDHPFLPTLYSYFDTDKFYCLVMEFCSGGNLHSLRQKQPNKHFTEEAARSVTFFFPHCFVLLRKLALSFPFQEFQSLNNHKF